MWKSDEWKLESLGCMVQEPQCGHEGQEMGFVSQIYLGSLMYVCMYVCTYCI